MWWYPELPSFNTTCIGVATLEPVAFKGEAQSTKSEQLKYSLGCGPHSESISRMFS